MGAYAELALALAAVVVAGVARPAGFPWALFPRRWRCWYRGLRPRGRQRSARIPKRLREQVMRADRRRCVFCGEQWRPLLQVDHITPWRLGGLTCMWNLAVLCQPCNLTKSDFFRDDRGRVYYRSWLGYRDKPAAAAILRRERLMRHSPLRWARAFL
jgi:HNH endonuclease